MVLTSPTREVRAKLSMNFLNTLVSPTGSISEIISNMVYCLRDPQGEKGTYEYALRGMFGGGSNIEDPGDSEKIKDVSKEYITVKIEDSSDAKAYKKNSIPIQQKAFPLQTKWKQCMRNFGSF